MANLHTFQGEKIRRGFSGVKKILDDPYHGYSMIWNDIDAQECYIYRFSKTEYYVQWWEGDEEKREEFSDRDKAIRLFLKIVKEYDGS